MKINFMSSQCATLFYCSNIPQNTILCEKCGVRVTKKNNKVIYCDQCAKEILAEQKREWSRINKKPKISEK